MTTVPAAEAEKWTIAFTRLQHLEISAETLSGAK
jgi:hypothetical protein